MVPRAVGFTIVWPEGVIFGSSVTNGLLSSRDATVIETLRTVVAANPKDAGNLLMDNHFIQGADWSSRSIVRILDRA